MTIQLEFTPELITEIRYQRYNHLVPLVQRRMETLLLKAHQLSPEQIEEIVGVTGNTIREYYELYQQGGIEKLKEINYYKPEGELVKHIVSLEAYFRENPPASIKEAQKEIEEITGVKRSETQVREFLKKKQSPLQESRQPAPFGKADPEKQKEFLDQELQPRLDEAQAGKRVVLFVDAAHCLICFSRLSVVGGSYIYSSAVWSSTVQRLGCAQCHYPRNDHRHQRHVHYCSERVCAIGEDCGALHRHTHYHHSG